MPYGYNKDQNVITVPIGEGEAAKWLSTWILARRNMPNIQSSIENNPDVIYDQLNNMAKYEVKPWSPLYNTGIKDTLGITFYDDNYISYNGEQPTDVHVHERTHALSHNQPQIKRIREIQNSMPYKRDKGFLRDVWNYLWYVNQDEWEEYLARPEEIYSRLMQYRYLNDLHPKKVWTLDEVKDLRNNSKDVDLFEEYEDEFILKLLNEIAQNKQQDNNVSYANNGSKLIPKKKYIK